MVKKFLFFFLSQRGERGRVFAVFFAPFPEKGIPDYIAHRPIIQVFTVLLSHTISILNQHFGQNIMAQSTHTRSVKFGYGNVNVGHTGGTT